MAERNEEINEGVVGQAKSTSRLSVSDRHLHSFSPLGRVNDMPDGGVHLLAGCSGVGGLGGEVARGGLSVVPVF